MTEAMMVVLPIAFGVPIPIWSDPSDCCVNAAASERFRRLTLVP